LPFYLEKSVEASLQKTDLWNDIVSTVEQRLNKHIVDSWFRPVQFEGNDAVERTLHLRAGQVTKDWVTLYYSELLAKTLETISIQGCRVPRRLRVSP
jgi:hypothetical protein